MIEMLLYIWLLGAVLIFVGVALSGEATDRFEAIWLLALAASWPLVLLFMALGVLLLAISAAAGVKR